MNYIGTKEAARRLRLSVDMVNVMINHGDLPADRVGRDWLIKIEDVDALVEHREQMLQTNTGKRGGPGKPRTYHR